MFSEMMPSGLVRFVRKGPKGQIYFSGLCVCDCVCVCVCVNCVNTLNIYLDDNRNKVFIVGVVDDRRLNLLAA